MKLNNAIKILEHHQEWRLGNNNVMLEPKTITNAINTILYYAKYDIKELLYDYSITLNKTNEEINEIIDNYLK